MSAATTLADAVSRLTSALSTVDFPVRPRSRSLAEADQIVLERLSLMGLLQSGSGAKLAVASALTLGLALPLFFLSFLKLTPRRLTIRGRRLFADNLLPAAGVAIDDIAVRRVQRRVAGVPVAFAVHLAYRDQRGRHRLLVLDAACFPRLQFDNFVPVMYSSLH